MIMVIEFLCITIMSCGPICPQLHRAVCKGLISQGRQDGFQPHAFRIFQNRKDPFAFRFTLFHVSEVVKVEPYLQCAHAPQRKILHIPVNAFKWSRVKVIFIMCAKVHCRHFFIGFINAILQLWIPKDSACQLPKLRIGSRAQFIAFAGSAEFVHRFVKIQGKIKLVLRPSVQRVRNHAERLIIFIKSNHISSDLI